MDRRTAFEPASMAAMCTGSGMVQLTPEMRKGGRRCVLGSTNPQMFRDALAQLLVHRGNRQFAIELDEAVALRHDLKFAPDHRLVAHERPVQIVRERHIAPSLPIADCLRL